MTTSHEREPNDIDLRSVGYLLKRSLPAMLVSAAVVAAATYGVLSTMAPRFSSEAMIAIISKGAANPYADPARSGQSSELSVRMDKEAVNTHLAALRSPNLAQTVADALNLKDKPEFNSELGATDTYTAVMNSLGVGLPRAGESTEDRVLTAFGKRLEIYSPKESRSIGIRFSSLDPDLAAEVANRLAEAYREALANQSIQETDDVQRALEPKIQKLSEEAAAAEAAVEKFRGEANIFKGGQQQTGLNEQQLAELNAELSRVKAARSEADARAKQARDMLANGTADILADVQKSPLIQSLVQSRVRLERQVSELSTTLLPGHPRMRQLNAELAGLNTQIKSETAKIVDSLSKEAKVAALREEAVAKSVADVKTRIVSTGPDEAKLRSLESDARSKRAELERLRSQYEANRVRADDARAVPVEVQIVSTARPAAIPVFPKKTSSALLAALATIMISIASTLTRGLLSGAARAPREGFNTRPHTPDFAEPLHTATHGPESQSQQRTEPAAQKRPIVAPPDQAMSYSSQAMAPSLAGEPRVPVAAKAEPSATPSTANQPISQADVAERLEQIRSRGHTGARTLVTSRTSKTLAHEVMGITSELAKRGSTAIIIDWNLASDGIARHLGHSTSLGMVQLLRDEATFEDVVQALPQDGVHLLPQGSGMIDDALSAADVNAVLDALDGVYDHIVVAATTSEAAGLFETIEGRFDCGIMIAASEMAGETSPGRFLGFEIEGMEVLVYEPRKPIFGHRLARAS